MSTQQIIESWEAGVEPYNATTKRIAELELACSQILQCLKHHFSPHDRNWCVARLEQITKQFPTA